MPRPERRSLSIPLIVGAVLVLGLIGFSLSRTVERSTPSSTVATTPEQPAALPSTSSAVPPAAAAAQPVDSAAAGAFPPLVSSRGAVDAPITAPPLDEPEPSGAVLASIPRTAPEDLLSRLQAKKVTILDVRDADSFMARHIPGALHIPLSRIDGEVPYLPRDKPIVAYCT